MLTSASHTLSFQGLLQLKKLTKMVSHCLVGKKTDELTMSNTATVLPDDIVNWFISMKKMGFKIKIVGFDKKFGREFFLKMKKSGFRIQDQPQYFYVKSEGFRHIEVKVKNKKFYYLHSDAF